MGRRNGKVKLAALIVVGEGPQDKAFLNYMKSLHDIRESGQTVTISSADGGSPGDIINTVIRKHRHTDFDERYVLLDSDVPISQQVRAKAKKQKIVLIESTPHCLEGMLLDVLGQFIPSTSKACKAAMHPQLSSEPTNPKAYAALFPQSVLDDSTKKQIVTLRHAITNTKPPR